MLRTKKERQEEVKKIISKLTELKLTIIYEPIQLLFTLLQSYIHEGKTIKINIPFPTIRKTIVGILPTDKHRECWVKLTSH